jgi:hypothetical protein
MKKNQHVLINIFKIILSFSLEKKILTANSIFNDATTNTSLSSGKPITKTSVLYEYKFKAVKLS